MAGIWSQVVSVFRLTLMGVLTVDVRRLEVVTPSTVSVRIKSPAVVFGRHDWTVRSQLVMSYGAGTVTSLENWAPLLSCAVTVRLVVERTVTPLATARAESALVETMCSFWPATFSN